MTEKKVFSVYTIFIAILIIRLILAFSTPNLTYDSYFHLIQVEHITQSGIPLFDDPLSYGGREHLFLPLFHYLAAFFNLFLPLGIVAKLLPNVLIASLTIIIYKISFKISKNHNAALISSFIAGLLPALYATNSFTPSTLFFPLIFFTIYSFMNIDKTKSPNHYLFSFVLLSFTHSAAALLLVGFIIYLALSFLEKRNLIKKELELIIFSFFFYAWSQFLFFKKNLLEEGVGFIWQNIPPQIIQSYFPTFSIIDSLLLISVIPFVIGIFVVYRSLFFTRDKKTFFLISLAISTTSLTWLKLIQFSQSLTFFGIILALLFANFYQELQKYMIKTKASKLQNIIPLTLIIILAVTMLPSAISISLNQDIPSSEEIETFKWIEENTPPDSGVLSLLEEGHLVTFFSKRKNLMDTEFSRIENIERRFSALNSLYRTTLQTEAIELLKEYDIEYLVLTPRAQERYNITHFKYYTPRCLKKIFNNDKTRIFFGRCVLEEIK